MNHPIYEQTKAVIAELCEKAKLHPGNIVVVGCSTSEVVGSKIGTNSNPDIAGEIFAALHDYTKSKGIFLAIQCCEHLNRAIVTERKAVPFAESVNEMQCSGYVFDILTTPSVPSKRGNIITSCGYFLP